MRRRYGIVLVFALVLAACASGGDDVTTEDPQDDTEQDVAVVDNSEGWLADVSLAAATLEELDEMRFVGVDTSHDLSTIDVYVGSDVGEWILPLYLDDVGLYSIAPLHPVTPGDGGSIEVWLADDAGASARLPLELTGLPDAAGAWDAMIVDLTDEIDARAKLLDSSFDDLASTGFDTVAGVLLPLKLVQGVVNDGSENDLESLISSADFTAQERDIVDALTAKVDLMSMLPTRYAVQSNGFRSVSGRDAALTTLAVIAPAAPALQADCFEYPLSITSGTQLANAIRIGVDNTVTSGGAEEQVLQDIQALASDASGLPLIGKGVAAIGTAFSVLSTLLDATSGVYPTQLVSITTQVSTTVFNEDFKRDGTVDQVKVVATSTGFDASEAVASLSKEAVKKLFGKLVGKLAKGPGDPVYGPLTEEGLLDSQIEEEVLKQGKKLNNSVTGAYIDAITDGYYNICPQEWTVDITDNDFVALSANIGRISTDGDALTYKPLEVGPDQLKVRARAEAFSGLTIEMVIDVETKRLRVIVSPDMIRVDDPGQEYDVTAVVENADTTTLHWDPGKGLWTDGTGEDTNDGRTRSHKTSANSEDYPYAAIVTSTSTTGLREGATDERNDTVWFELAEFKILPNPGQVGTGQPLQFVAIDHDGNPVDVTWEATGGSISSSGGLYVAGDEPGTYSVTATKVGDSSKVATAVVEVVDVDCLVGTWDIDEQDFIDQLGSTAGFSASHIGGQYRIVMRADGTYTGFRDDWTFQIPGPGGDLRMTITSEDPGEWVKLDDTTLKIEDFGSSPTVVMGIVIGGELRSLPFGTQTPDIPGMEGTGQYECSGNFLNVTNQGINVKMVRIGPAT